MREEWVELLDLDLATGGRTGLPRALKSALLALQKAKVRYAVVGAVALGVRGLPRMTRHLDIVVSPGSASAAIEALERARRASVMRVEVDVLVAAGEPEATVISEAAPARVLGVSAPVASLEHLLLMYLYSNQPEHLGDFARIVTESKVNLGAVERWLKEEHREMLSTFRTRVKEAQEPPEAPPRPKPKTKRR
jgi:hypothetical protein